MGENVSPKQWTSTIMFRFEWNFFIWKGMVRNENHDTIFSPMVNPLPPMGGKRFPQIAVFYNNGPIWVKLVSYGREWWEMKTMIQFSPPYGQAHCPHGWKHLPQTMNFHNNVPIWLKLDSYGRSVRNEHHDTIFPPWSTPFPPWGENVSPK